MKNKKINNYRNMINNKLLFLMKIIKIKTNNKKIYPLINNKNIMNIKKILQVKI